MKRILFGQDSKQPASSHVAQSTQLSTNQSQSQSTSNLPSTSQPTSTDSSNVQFLSTHTNLNLNGSMRSTSYASSIHSNHYFDHQHLSNNNNNHSNPSTPIPQSVSIPFPQPQGQQSQLNTSPSSNQVDFIPTPIGPSINPDSNSSSQQLNAQYGIERTDLHKSLKSLESLLVSLDEYRDLSNKLSKVEKRIAKNASELAKGKALKEIPAQTLLASSALFESLTETSSKHSKYLQKEYESLNEACGKFFKKIAKEEKIQDETLETLDSKIKRAQQSYEKSSKSKSNIGIKAVESHDKYMTLIGNLSNEMTLKKKDHSISTGLKNHSINLLIASTMGGLADSKFKKLCEEVRKSGSHVGKLNEWLNFCLMSCNNPNESMPNGQPVYLDEDEFGLATKMVQMQSLLYNQAQNNALKQAELFNKEQIKEESLLRAKEEEFRQEELARKAREMGWLPPSTNQNQEDSNSIRKSTPSPSEQQQPSVQFSNLPRLDSSGQELKSTNNKEASSPGGGKSNNTSISTSNNSLLNNSLSNLDNDMVNHGSNGGTSIETSSNVNDNSRSGSGSLNRNETFQSMKVEPSSWENEKEIIRSQSPTNSVHEGTVVDKGEEDLNSDLGEETNLFGGKAASSSSPISSTSNNVQFIQKEVSGESKGILQNGNNNGKDNKDQKTSFQEPSNNTPTPNRTFTTSPIPNSQSLPENESNEPSSVNNTPVTLERKRTTSLWERERERSKILDRERELSTKLNEFKNENRDRSTIEDRRDYSRESTPRASVGYSNSNLGDLSSTSSSSVLDRPRPTRYSLDSSNRAGVGTGSFNKHNGSPSGPGPNGNGVGYLYKQEIVDDSTSRDQYAPSVGKSKLNGGAVSRTLSTDTTSSERSFVARMKAKYQAEKERDRERELLERERERDRDVGRRPIGGDSYPNHAYDYDRDRDRRVATPPNLPPNTRRVSDLASQYSDRDRDSRSWALSPSSNNQTLPRDHRDRLPPPSDEFGSLRNHPPPPRSPRSIHQGQVDRDHHDDVPHSSVCGCARCSATKYASSSQQGQGQGRISPNPGRVSPNYDNRNNIGYSSVKSNKGYMNQIPTSSNSSSSLSNQSNGNRLRPQAQPHPDSSYSYNNGRSVGDSGYSNDYDRSYDRDYPSSRNREFAPPPVTTQREPNVRRQSLPPTKASLEPPGKLGYGGDRVGAHLEENVARRSFERN